MRYHCRARVEGNFRTTPVQVVSTVTLPVAKTVAAPRSGQKPPAPHPLFTAAREVKPVAAVSTVSPVVPPRPLRTVEQTAALWIAPYIDSGIFTISRPAYFCH